MNIGDEISGAIFSEDGTCRYALWRIWDRCLPALMFNGLNASTANRYKNDPTIIRMVGFGKAWGFGGLYVGNLEPFVSPHPADLIRWLKTPGHEKHVALADEAMRQMRSLSSTAMVGWGNDGRRLGSRVDKVIALLGEPVYCIKVNPSGEPTHPLYQPLGSRLMPYIRKTLI